MSTAPLKSHPLHNFSLSLLKWGGTNSHHDDDAATPNNHRFTRPDHEPRTRPARSKRCALSPSTRNHNDDDDENKKIAAVAGVAEAATEEPVQKPWNLRPRRPAEAWRSGNGEAQERGVTVHGEAKSTRVREMMEVAEGSQSSMKKYWFDLSKGEIAADFISLTGSKPSRNPKKRPEEDQKHHDRLSPGYMLSGRCADSFRENDEPAARKRKRRQIRL